MSKLSNTPTKTDADRMRLACQDVLRKMWHEGLRWRHGLGADVINEAVERLGAVELEGDGDG